MSKPSDTLVIRGTTLKNRIAFLPVMTFSFTNEGSGFYGQQHLDHYVEVAKGDAGLIILQATNVAGVLTASGQWTPSSQAVLATSVIRTLCICGSIRIRRAL
jgi:2,4-dienoyl-CoA reductase-like NADH-dependent reductase (Old Yellow Enzyme family)